MTFDEQVAAMRDRGLDTVAMEAARPAQPAERSALVLSREVLAVADAAARVERRGKPVVLGQMEPEELDGYVPIAAVELPDAPAYLRSTWTSGSRAATCGPRTPFATSSPPAARR